MRKKAIRAYPICLDQMTHLQTGPSLLDNPEIIKREKCEPFSEIEYIQIIQAPKQPNWHLNFHEIYGNHLIADDLFMLFHFFQS